MKLSSRLNGVGEYYFSQKLREIESINRTGPSVINLGIGSPDLPPHPEVIEVLRQESSKPNVHAYQSYKGSAVLRNAIAQWYSQWYGVSLNAEEEILPLMGSKEGIMHLCMTYLDPGDKALVPNPGYPTYASAVKLAGGMAVEYELNESNQWQPDFDAMEKTDLSAVKLMWVNYPQMPSGQPADVKVFERLIQFARKQSILICHDNPYSFILNNQPLSLLSVPGALDYAVELNSLSKSHNMAGWRVGMLCGSKQRIEEVLRFKSNMDSGMYLPLQLAAAKALSIDHSWYDSINTAYQQRRSLAEKLLRLLNCSFQPQQVGMFLWAKIPNNYPSSFELSDRILQEARVFITPGGIFGSAGSQYVRISLCSTTGQFEESIKRIEIVI
jgi:aspartate/methionine/tyrosine aminotransferase